MSNRRNRSGRVRRPGNGEAVVDPWRWRRPLGTFLGAFIIFLVARTLFFGTDFAARDLIWVLGMALASTFVEEWGRARHQRNLR